MASLEKLISRLRKNDPNVTAVQIDSNTFLQEKPRKRVKLIEQLCDALGYNTHVTRLTMAKLGIRDDVAMALAKLLLENTTLRILYLNDNHLSFHAMKSISEALLSNSTLESLNVSNNPIQDKGIKCMLATLKKNQTLTELNVDNVRISAKGIKHIQGVAICNPKFVRISLQNNPIMAQGILHILRAQRKNKDLNANLGGKPLLGGSNALQIYHNLDKYVTTWMSEVAVKDLDQSPEKSLRDILRQVQSSSTNLVKLDLSGTLVGDRCCVLISDALPMNTTLKSLILHDCMINDPGANALAHGLVKNTTLTELDFGGNSIGDNGATDFYNLLVFNKSLKSLSLCGVKMPEDLAPFHGWSSLFEHIMHKAKLTTLNLSNTGLSPKVIKSLLLTNVTLKKLLVSGISSSVSNKSSCQKMVKAICEGLRRNKTLESLWLVGETDTLHLEALLPSISTNNGLKELSVRISSFDDVERLACISKICKCLQSKPNIKSLGLIHSDLGKPELTVLKAFLKQHRTITNLDLSGQYFDEDTIGIFSSLLQTAQLQGLTINETNIGDPTPLRMLRSFICNDIYLKTLTILRSGFNKQHGKYISKALKTNIGLEWVNLGQPKGVYKSLPDDNCNQFSTKFWRFMDEYFQYTVNT